MNKITSMELYTALVRADALVKSELGDNCYFVIWMGGYNAQPELTLEVKHYSSAVEEKVKGRDLCAMIDELKRRLDFQASQQLALTGPTVEGTVEEILVQEAPGVSALDDEIPF